MSRWLKLFVDNVIHVPYHEKEHWSNYIRAIKHNLKQTRMLAMPYDIRKNNWLPCVLEHWLFYIRWYPPLELSKSQVQCERMTV